MNLMLDFETFATTPRSVVLSLGAVLFDENKIIEKRYWKFEVQPQIKAGREVSASTLLWWLHQGEKAREVLEPNPQDVSLHIFCLQFTHWLKQNGFEESNGKVWGNGAAFDVPIIDSLYLDQGLEIPWRFYNVMCYRTFAKLTKCKDLAERKGTHHNALDDSVYQTECVLAAWKKQRIG